MYPGAVLFLRCFCLCFSRSHGGRSLFYLFTTKQLLQSIHQISPVFPHDYENTCLPVCALVWQVFNFSTDPLDVSITFTWHGPRPDPREASQQQPPTSGAAELNWLRPGAGPYDQFLLSDASDQQQSAAAAATEQPCASRSCSFTSRDTSTVGCLLERVLGDELPCCFGVGATRSESVGVTNTVSFPTRRCLRVSLSTVRQVSCESLSRVRWYNLNVIMLSRSSFVSDYFVPVVFSGGSTCSAGYCVCQLAFIVSNYYLELVGLQELLFVAPLFDISGEVGIYVNFNSSLCECPRDF